MLKIAHISDLHLFSPAFEMADLFSKRLLGQLNYFFKRKKHFEGEQLFYLLDLFLKERVEYVFVSGDLSSTSLETEFKEAQKLFSEMQKHGIKCFFVPGNHDHYTPEAQRKKFFYKYFENDSPIKLFSLKNDLAEAHFLKEKTWYAGLDTSLPTGFLSSHGVFSVQAEKTLEQIFLKIPAEDRIIVVNHFPFLDITSQRKTLKRKQALRDMLQKQKNAVLYLHGHTHKHSIEDLRKHNLPLVLDSGSAALNTIGRLNIVSLQEEKCKIEVFAFKNSWKKTQARYFSI